MILLRCSNDVLDVNIFALWSILYSLFFAFLCCWFDWCVAQGLFESNKKRSKPNGSSSSKRGEKKSTNSICLICSRLLFRVFLFYWALSAWYFNVHTQHTYKYSRRFHFVFIFCFVSIDAFFDEKVCSVFLLYSYIHKLTVLTLWSSQQNWHTLWNVLLLHVSMMMWNTRMVHNQMNIATKIVYDDVPISWDK